MCVQSEGGSIEIYICLSFSLPAGPASSCQKLRASKSPTVIMCFAKKETGKKKKKKKKQREEGINKELKINNSEPAVYEKARTHRE